MKCALSPVSAHSSVVKKTERNFDSRKSHSSITGTMLMQWYFACLLFGSVLCQKFGKMREVSSGCENVTLAVEVDPQSSTFAFNWFLRVNGSSTNVNLALVGLNGAGSVGVILNNNSYSNQYAISNNPEDLQTPTSLWNSSLTFNFPDKVTSFDFLVSTVTLEEMIPKKYNGSICHVIRRCNFLTFNEFICIFPLSMLGGIALIFALLIIFGSNTARICIPGPTPKLIPGQAVELKVKLKPSCCDWIFGINWYAKKVTMDPANASFNENGDNTTVASGGRITIKCTRKEITLTIKDATESDAGKYTCEGRTLLNRFKQEFNLTLHSDDFLPRPSERHALLA